MFRGTRGENLLDGGAPFYDVYPCLEGGWMSVGCLEPEFFKIFLEIFLKSLPRGFTMQDSWSPTLETQTDRTAWPKLREFLRKGFMTNTRDYWAKAFHGIYLETLDEPIDLTSAFLWLTGTDACAVPVLTPTEAGNLDASHSLVPVPHPLVGGRELRKDMLAVNETLRPGKHTRAILDELGITDEERRRLVQDEAVDAGDLVPVVAKL